VTPDDLAVTREAEQQEAAGSLGVREVVMLHYPDGELEDTKEFRKQIVRQIRRVQPEVVLCPEPYRKNLAWHRDHRITGQVTLDAVFPCARDHLHFEELWRDEGLEPHKTGTVLFWGTETPNAFVDIDSQLESKSRAVKANKSRVSGRSNEEIDDFIRQYGRDGVGDSGGNYGEAFRRVTFRT
jgi:LmbE family N-acetylglucosaminyl deacetylase